jgi:hypothetical protein
VPSGRVEPQNFTARAEHPAIRIGTVPSTPRLAGLGVLGVVIVAAGLVSIASTAASPNPACSVER